MNKPVVITTDSSADLLPHIRDEFGIQAIALHITLEGKSGRDCVDIFPMDIYNAFKQRGSLPKTAAPSMLEYKTFFEQHTSQGCAVVHISIGSRFSSCNQFASLAAEETVGEVHVFDSNQFCVGQGMLCIKAAQMRDEGLPAAEILDKLMRLRPKVKAMYYLHGLDFLAKSGRCPSVVAMGATLFNLHPCMYIDAETGEPVIGKKYRGKKAPEAWLRDCAAKFAATCDPSLCMFFYTPDLPGEQTGPMKELAKQLLPDVGRMLQDTVGCAIISHVGGNCYALIGLEK